MSDTRMSDPLLIAARVAIIGVKVLLGIVIVAVLLAVPLMLGQQDEIASALSRAGNLAEPWQAIVAILAFIGFLAALVGLLFWFFQNLDRIIISVAEQDPFTPRNARRLTAMGWITLAAQAIAFALDRLGQRINTLFPQGAGTDGWSFSIDGELSFSVEGVLLALVLFILARVFSKGAEMREDLEGTV